MVQRKDGGGPRGHKVIVDQGPIGEGATGVSLDPPAPIMDGGNTWERTRRKGGVLALSW